MENWERIFQGAKQIVSSSGTIEEAVAKAVTKARQSPAIFDEPDYWARVENHDFGASFDTVAHWADNALRQLRCPRRWDLLILDLGDCPEILFPYIAGAPEKISEKKLLGLFRQTLIGASEFERCFREHSDAWYDEFFGDRKELAEESVRELNDPMLNWTSQSDYHGNNGYFLWLIIGGFALFEALRTSGLSSRLSKEGKRLHILIGFEELFSHFKSVE